MHEQASFRFTSILPSSFVARTRCSAGWGPRASFAFSGHFSCEAASPPPFYAGIPEACTSVLVGLGHIIRLAVRKPELLALHPTAGRRGAWEEAAGHSAECQESFLLPGSCFLPFLHVLFFSVLRPTPGKLRMLFCTLAQLSSALKPPIARSCTAGGKTSEGEPKLGLHCSLCLLRQWPLVKGTSRPWMPPGSRFFYTSPSLQL